MNQEQKEKFLQLVSESIDAGADISIVNVTKKLSRAEAQRLAVQFRSILGGQLKVTEGEFSEWYSVTAGNHRCSFFHNESEIKNFLMEEAR